MRKLHIRLLLLTALFSGNLSAQITVHLNENFNNGFPAGWQNIDGDTLTPAGAVSFAGSAFSTHVDYDTITGGDSILVATSWFSPTGQASNYLILPQVTLQANGNQLIFELRSKDASYPEAFEILVSTTLGDTASLTDTIYTNTLASPNWTQYTIDLDAYSGMPVFLAFHHSSNDKFLICLDNVVVMSDLQLGIDESSGSFSKLFPNPVSDVLNISNEEGIHSVQVYDLNGRLVLNEASNGVSLLQVNVSALNAGMYIAEITTPTGISHQRFVRR